MAAAAQWQESCIRNGAVKSYDQWDPRCAAFYRDAMALLQEASVPFMVGGAFAFSKYTGIDRFTKDFDVFIHPGDVDRALEAFARAGYRTELTAPYWLAKAFKDELFVDFIWSSGNGVANVDDAWFARAPEDDILGMRAKIVPAEEMVWQKAYIMERERFDGADVLHVIQARADDLDWAHLVARFADHWRVLLAHLVLFGFAFPTERDRIPDDVMRLLIGKLDGELTNIYDGDHITQGTLLSRYQYRDDVHAGGYADARLLPPAELTADDLREVDDSGDRERECA